jgi:hypothetical protein
MQAREAQGRLASPSAGVIDGQRVKTTESGGPSGYDAGKKIKDRKRHMNQILDRKTPPPPTRFLAALDLVRRANRLLWSPHTSDAVARAAIRAAGVGFGAKRPDAASLFEKSWAELARAAAMSGDRQRLRGLMRNGGTPYAVIGDSHGRLLARRSCNQDGRWLMPLWWLETGASARGLGRAEAQSGAGERVRKAIGVALDIADTAPILLKFGQVDIEFVQVFKRLESGDRAFEPAGLQVFVDETVTRYMAFLIDAVAPADRPRVHLCSLFPPALSDAAWRSGYINAHIIELHGPADREGLAQRLDDLDVPNLAHRTALHANFNLALSSAAYAEGFGFHDDFTSFLGAAGVVDPCWLGSAAGTDHHLDFNATRARVVDQLWRLLERSFDLRERARS